MATVSPSTLLRRAIEKGCVMMPGAFNGFSARLVERAGFDAVYLSGAGIANATGGVPDVGLLTMSEVAQLAGYAARAVKIPAIVDADTGFGGAQNVTRVIQEFEAQGLAGLHLEDQTFPKRCGHLAGKAVVATDEMCEKLEFAKKAKRNPDFLVIARTDSRAVEGFDAAVTRANAYLKAGADAIFIEALESEDEFRKFAQLVKSPLLANMTEFGKSPLLSAQQLADFGYRMVIFPMSAFRVSMRAAEDFLRDLRKDKTQKPWLDKMQTRQQLYEILKYDPAKPWPME